MTERRIVDIWIESQGQRWEHAHVHRLSGREAIGQLFSFDLDVACDPDRDLPERALPGEEVSLVFEIDGAEIRRIHGIFGPVRSHLGGADDHATYRLRVVPRAARLALVETQEIYLNQSIPDILRTKLERHDFGGRDFELRLMSAYPARELVVQYRESDLAFVSRLAEHAGISFYFEHEDGRDVLVFTDHPAGFRPAPGAEEARVVARGEKSGVFALDHVSDVAPTSYIVQDYNYRTPQVDLAAVFDLESGNGGGVVEYGAHVKTPAEAEILARVRGEERRARQTVYEGKSGVMGLSAGRPVTVADIPRRTGHVAPARPDPHTPGPAGSETLLLVEVTHEAIVPVFGEAAHPAEPHHYANAFRAVPAGFTYRPPRLTPRPQINGVVTGIIQPGPDGETGGVAQIDSEGRYTVQLHFDTTQPGEQKASHPIRMAQPFAGPSYGMNFPLRRGTEVAVAFANGDPDRPVILGALYNTTSPSPVVASNATRHQLKASSGAIFEFGSKS